MAWYSLYTTHNYVEITMRLKQELHLEICTLGKMYSQFNDEIDELKKKKPSVKYFREKYQWLVWSV